MSPSATTPAAVLVMAYGGPSNLDEIPGYLADIRGGRPTSAAILHEITENYRAIGGASPLPAQVRAQTAALEARFAGQPVRFYTGMRHWSPWIEDAVGQMLADGVKKAVSLVLAPHYSRESIAKYQERIVAGERLFQKRYPGTSIRWRPIESYHTGEHLIRAFAQRVAEGLSRWPPGERPSVHVMFSAHALPIRVIQAGDPYQDQLFETVDLVVKAAGLAPDRWSWCYQSAGRTPEPWLGPPMEKHLADLASRGIRNVVSIPIGFVSDHVEILYDIDIKARAQAGQLGIRLERPPALGTDPLFIDQLESEVQRALADLGGAG